MRIGVVAESAWERLLLRLGLYPTPLAETHLAFLHARAVMVAVEAGVFEELAHGPRSAADVAAGRGLDPHATASLLRALESGRYVRRRGDAFALTPSTRRWLLAESPRSVREKMRFHFDEWRFVEHLDHFVHTGEPVDLHRQLSAEGWGRYQRAMDNLARLAAGEVARRLPVPSGATALLDLGGGLGRYAAAASAANPGLRATVLDLPEALAAAPHRDEGAGGDRVTYRAGDARSDDLGEGVWDVVLMVNLAHHLTEADNRQLAARVAGALRPGGAFILVEWVRPASAREARRAGCGALLDLYFALTSRSGTWSLDEMAAWQREAGLAPDRPRWLRTLPGCAMLSAHKPA